MVRDLLEEVAYELDRVHEMFPMPAPDYEESLRKLSLQVLVYRNNIINALDHLEKANCFIFEANETESFKAYEHIVEATDKLLYLDDCFK